ncbi:hypothetical protein AB0C02_19600 [Micromonospora sp. NPDC048999]|uniref:hypothetical protein n=1 Tax=Micromonospora sp. NPDC048999 TaxID=3155391 RepID=UPI0033FE848F
MSRISKKHMLAGLAAAGVLSVGIAAPAVAFADDKPAPTPSATSTQADNHQRPDRQAKFAEELAKELGVSTDQVTAALKKIGAEHKADRPERPAGANRHEKPQDRQELRAKMQEKLQQRLDQAVKDGKLTQDEADAIVKAVKSGVFQGLGGEHFRGHWGPGAKSGK